MVLYERCVQLKWRDGTTNEIRELWERGILKGRLHVLCLFLCSLWQYLGYSFLSRISHIFFPKITQNCVGVCYSEQMLAGVEAPKTSPINKDSCFLSPSPCDEEALSAGVGENLCRYQHLVAILIHWSIMKLQEWLAVNAVQDCLYAFSWPCRIIYWIELSFGFIGYINKFCIRTGECHEHTVAVPFDYHIVLKCYSKVLPVSG